MTPSTAKPAAILSATLSRRLSPDFEVSLDLELRPGITVLYGPSGSGKTTILQMLAGLLRPEKGSISLGSSVLFDSNSGIDLEPQKRRFGYVFQHLALFPHLTAAENVMFGLAHLPSAERQHRARMLLDEFFGLSRVAAQRPHQLSGGERQRVALARALAPQPNLLLLDEPLSALDSATKSRILEELILWSRSNPIPILYVTHDRDEIFSAAHHVIVLENGRKISEGSPDQALLTPRSFQVARSADFENVFQARILARDDASGTMTCDLRGATIECPLPHGALKDEVGIAIHAGDILLASEPPKGLSARNVIAGAVKGLTRKDRSVAVEVECSEGDGSVTFISNVTRQAVYSLGLEPGKPVWIVFKTHSCHVLLD